MSDYDDWKLASPDDEPDGEDEQDEQDLLEAEGDRQYHESVDGLL